MSILFMAILTAGLIGPLDETVVSPAWLEQNLDNPNVIVVEIGSSAPAGRHTVSSATWPFGRDPHIPGARFIAIESLVNREQWPLDELPPAGRLRTALERAGIGDEGRIIVYSANPLWATRAWFTLDYLGHGGRAAILDGGFARWRSEKRPIATRRMQHAAATFTPRVDMARLLSHRDMHAAWVAGNIVMIDARPEAEFTGSRRGQRVARSGHIPGAHCNPWQANLATDGSFQSAAKLSSAYEALIPTIDKRVIVYCRTGMEASMPYFVLRSLGYDVALYDGSYMQWSRDKSVPVATLASR